MANALPTGKLNMPRARAPSSAQHAVKLHGKQVTNPSMATPPPARRSASSAAKLRAGSELLTQATRTFPTAGSGNDGAVGVEEFRQAYLTIAQSIPKMHRLALLETMRASIDELVHAEQGDAVAPVMAEHKGVSTAGYMADLARQEEVRRATEIATGRLVSGAQMRERLQVSPQALSAALKKKRMFALVGPSGEYLYPAFFADQKLDRREVERISLALGELPGASKWDFFTAPRLSLGGKTALQALEKGKVDAVLDAANAFRDE